MAKYVITIDGDIWTKEKSKDGVIASLMGYINGDGVIQVKVEYPDKTYYEFTGE
tara:strand:+ start:111 stop:272 length:162 start_codon:yes stop_codon:yes gene_type:complete